MVHSDSRNENSSQTFIRLASTDSEQTMGTTISFRNINYTINTGNNLCTKLSCYRSISNRQILSDVSGSFQPGINAILGPTGCGKSTLLDILADRKDRGTYEGHVSINRHSRPASSIYRYMTGYVVQDDIFSGVLTVRENIAFSANLRLPCSMTRTERLERVEKVIEQLGLKECANTRMGTEFQRGVSGGERKRTCIAMEMVLEPIILFLDEPTTGLDSSTAFNVIQCLHDLSQTGCTIIFSIHQPSHAIFKLFDTVLLMLHGHTVYFGPSSELMPYFSAQGVSYDPHANPADHALDMLHHASSSSSEVQNLYENYRQSSMYNEYETSFSDNVDDYDTYCVTQKLDRSIKSDFFYVSQRTLRNAMRNSALIIWQIAVAIILGILTGLLYYKLPRTTDSGVENRLGGIFFIVVNQIFSTATALEPFIKERALFIHENVSGYYSISTLFLAKLICDLLPMRVIPSLVFSIICYFMIGLQRTTTKFLIFVLTIFMANVFGSAMCFFIAATIPVFAVALIVLVLVFVIMMVFSGFLVELTSVFSFLRWIKWMSAFRYASNVLTINEFHNIQFCLANQTNLCPSSGVDILRKRSIDHESNWDLWKYFLALTLMAVLSFLMAYVRLRLIKKVK
ncbi:unnamed protein product [Adineta steineri]|uniref:ABC transporter domain-containing protein n=1 Tax=Adineta steineri TaxID=433720 RepID=A0A815S9A6_9BILA|nr:unnamed protein product [Adineta steineri]CAF4040090.1 unnamed protein product [Adineta steineri]